MDGIFLQWQWCFNTHVVLHYRSIRPYESVRVPGHFIREHIVIIRWAWYYLKIAQLLQMIIWSCHFKMPDAKFENFIATLVEFLTFFLFLREGMQLDSKLSWLQTSSWNTTLQTSNALHVDFNLLINTLLECSDTLTDEKHVAPRQDRYLGGGCLKNFE